MRKSYKKYLTREWVSKQFDDKNQFEIVNLFIDRARDKAMRDVGDEFGDQKNIAIEVLSDLSEEQDEFYDENDDFEDDFELDESSLKFTETMVEVDKE
ncbi:MAG: hypothetical protein Tsb0021_00380 [Chlamydiales bacterium]